MADRPPSPGPELDWFVVERWQEYAGERRANLLRAGVLACFYVIELVNRHGLPPLSIAPDPSITAEFHFAVTVLTVGWVLSSWGLLVLLRSRIFPPKLKFFTTAVDAAFLTAVLAAADGPRSPLAGGFLLLICLAGLRMNLALVRAAGLFCGLGALLVWLLHAGQPTRAPGYFLAIQLVSTAACAVLVGQIIRRARAAAEDYAHRRGKGL